MMDARPFSEQEKRFVLAEVIKASPVPLERLLGVIKEENFSPAWVEVLLPGGRNLKACMDMFDSLMAAPPQTSHKRKSTSEFLDPSPDSSRKRRQSGLDTVTVARNIQPKPAANGSPYSAQSLPTTLPKKRGRPSKADIETRQAEAMARGDFFPVPKTIPPGKGQQKSAIDGSGVAIAPMRVLEPVSESGLGKPPDSEVCDVWGKKKRGRPSSSKSKTPNTGDGTFDSEHTQFPPAEPVEVLNTPILQEPMLVKPDSLINYSSEAGVQESQAPATQPSSGTQI